MSEQRGHYIFRRDKDNSATLWYIMASSEEEAREELAFWEEHHASYELVGFDSAAFRESIVLGGTGEPLANDEGV